MVALAYAGLLGSQSALAVPDQPQTWEKCAGIAATFLLAALVGFVIGRVPTDTELLDLAIQERVHNHVLHMPLEVKGGAVDGLREYFHRLEFDPVESGAWGTSLALLGGRYCSIQGQAAAQLRYAATRRESVTVFQLPVDERLRGRLPVQRNVGGVRVIVRPVGNLMVVRVAGRPD
ncbi:MAG: hypothetical protein HOI95_05025 [Chromatiales bacterium]|nr:hypothetical protein [Chromatiales bacterium]